MTVIVAVHSDNETLVGYNNGSILGGTPIQSKYVPWIFFGDWALGITGESSVQRVLVRDTKAFRDEGASAEDVIDFINKTLLKNGFGSKEDNEYVVTFGIWGILLNKNGRMWDVSGCLSLTEISIGVLWAQGSGADYAMGASHVIGEMAPDMPPQLKVKLCVEAAIANDIDCVGDAVVLPWGKALS